MCEDRQRWTAVSHAARADGSSFVGHGQRRLSWVKQVSHGWHEVEVV